MATSKQAKQLLQLHGEVRPQPCTDWDGSIPLPPAVEEFYREVGPADVFIEDYGNPYFLPSLSDLWKFQTGYRWDGSTGEPLEDWDDDWLVVADEGGDPFILSRTTGEVLHAYHGEGTWDAVEMFPDLNAMAACLAQLGAIVLDAGDELTDDEDAIDPKYRRQALTKLKSFLGSKTAAESVLARLGWD